MRRLHARDDDTLILLRGKLALRPGEEHDDRPQHDNADKQDSGAGIERLREQPVIDLRQLMHVLFDCAGQPPLGGLCAKKPTAHHGRKRQGNHAGDDHCTGKGKGKLLKQRARQTTHQTDRGIDRSQRNRHGNHGADDLPCAAERRLLRRVPLFDVAMDVLDDDDSIIDH